jgi:hypothetical protein
MNLSSNGNGDGSVAGSIQSIQSTTPSQQRGSPSSFQSDISQLTQDHQPPASSMDYHPFETTANDASSQQQQQQQQQQADGESMTMWIVTRDEFKALFRDLLDYTAKKNWKKKVMTLLVMSSSLAVFIDLLFLGHIQTLLQGFIFWMADNNVKAIFAFIVLFVVATRKSKVNTV